MAISDHHIALKRNVLGPVASVVYFIILIYNLSYTLLYNTDLIYLVNDVMAMTVLSVIFICYQNGVPYLKLLVR